MTDKDIISQLQHNFIHEGSGQINYEKAKKIILPDMMGLLDAKEYEARIKVICEYLRV